MNRFSTKAEARQAVWDALTEKKAARFPFPAHGRIPNFAGAKEAAQRLMAHPIFNKVKCIKVNPDSPQRYVREGALKRGITVIVPTPRLKGGFKKFDPAKIPKDKYAEAANLSTSERWAEEVPLKALPRIDLIVTGSVAVTRDGRRCGKGHGYGDLEYAIYRELGHAPVAVVTTVHRLQLVKRFPTDSHDLPVSLIATPEEVIEIANPPPSPEGVDWEKLPAQALQEMPVLLSLRELKTPARRRRHVGSTPRQQD